MPEDAFIPLNAHEDFHWLSEGLNADERDLPAERPAFVKGHARTSRGGIVSHGATFAERVQADSLAWHAAHPLNG